MSRGNQKKGKAWSKPRHGWWPFATFDEALDQYNRGSGKTRNERSLPLFRHCWYSLVVVLFCLAIAFVVLHPPIDSYKLFAYTSFFGVMLLVSMLVSTGLWSKPIFRRTPLLLIPHVFLVCIVLYPVVTHSPIDYLELFGYLALFAYSLFGYLKALARERNKPI